MVKLPIRRHRRTSEWSHLDKVSANLREIISPVFSPVILAHLAGSGHNWRIMKCVSGNNEAVVTVALCCRGAQFVLLF